MYKLVIPGELPDLNKIIGASKNHYGAYSKLKKEYTDMIAILANKTPPMGKIKLEITWHCKNRRKDKDNIAAGIKFILDGLVNAGVIKDDSWKEIKGFTHIFKVDAKNPRVEVDIERVG